MAYQSYFESAERERNDDVDAILEEVDVRGYAVVPDVLSASEVATYRGAVLQVYEQQRAEVGDERLAAIGETGMVRALIAYDLVFADVIRHDLVYAVLARTLGTTAILHLINAIIAAPSKSHHQGNLHRDFAKPFATDRPISLNFFFLLDEFRADNGATWFVPHTHRIRVKPSAEYVADYRQQVLGDPGSLVVFDSRIYHHAGANRSNEPRIGMNLQFTLPFIKQQIRLPKMLKDRIDPESPLAQSLGMWAIPPESVQEFRVLPEDRTYRAGQG